MNVTAELSSSAIRFLLEHGQYTIASLIDAGILPATGLGLAFALPLAPDPGGPPLEGILAAAKRWHGNTGEKYTNVNIVVDLLKTNLDPWAVPTDMFTRLSTLRNQAGVLIEQGKSPDASTNSRAHRDTILKMAVGICLHEVKYWAIGQFGAGVITRDNLHALCFLLPGENAGRHNREESTNIRPVVKVTVTNEDFIRVVIDQSAGENAAQVVHGWPVGIRHATIVITAADGTTEIFRQQTTHLHNNIKLPPGSHGKQFILKAAFLKHVDDDPRFGNQETFSMPLTTEDLAAAAEHHYQEEVKAQEASVERHRLEVEHLQAEIDRLRGQK
jgi:hypothetical protein